MSHHGVVRLGVARLGVASACFVAMGCGGGDGARLVSTLPEDGAVAVAPDLSEVELRFSAPVQLGRVVVTAGGRSIAPGVELSQDRRSAILRVDGLLANDERVEVALEGWLDEAGDAVEVETTLPDGLLRFVVGDRPTVETSHPENGDGDVYPAPLSGRVRFSVRFSEVMNPAAGELELIGPASTSRLSVTWETPEGREASAEIVAPVTTGAPPLQPGSDYLLRLVGFEDAAGNPLEPDTVIPFRTGPLDPLLNHACGHTGFGPFADAVATASPDGAPLTSTGHVSYRIVLPALTGGAFGGYVGLAPSAHDTFDLFLDREASLAVTPRATPDAEQALTVAAAAPACEGITHRAQVTFHSDEPRVLFVGPVSSAEVQMIVEIAKGAP